jgi:hypothetical protein
MLAGQQTFNTWDGSDKYFRAPATPIWVHSPYLNWLSPSDRPNDDWVWHVRNDKVGSLTVALRVDGVAHSLLGPLSTACPPGPLKMSSLPTIGPAAILPTRTIFSYSGAGIVANLTFASPKFIQDLDSYVPILLAEISVHSTDGAAHSVEAFMEVAGQLAVDADTTPVSWARLPPGALPAAAVGMRIWNPAGKPLREYTPFDPTTATGGQPTEHLDWGAAHLTAIGAGGVSSWMGSSNVARKAFALSGAVPQEPDESTMPLPACASGSCRCAEGGRASLNDWPSLTASWHLGEVTHSASSRAAAVLAYDDLGASARYFGRVLPEFWRRGGRSFAEMLANATAQHAQLLERCAAFDASMMAEMHTAGGADFAGIGALAYRQVLGDNSIVEQPAIFGFPASAAPFMFVKGLGSSGDTGTSEDTTEHSHTLPPSHSPHPHKCMHRAASSQDPTRTYPCAAMPCPER